MIADEEKKVELTESANYEQEDEANKDNAIFEHEFAPEQLEMHFDTHLENGLTESEAAIRLQRDGENALTPPPKPFWLWKALSHILGGFSLLLWAGSILCFIVYGLDSSIDNLVLGVVLAAVVLGTGIFSYYQEKKSDDLLESFLKLTPTSCFVIRNGIDVSIPTESLVIGDVVRLEGGKKIPADVIVIEAFGVKVDNSSLTGEAEPLKRGVECTDSSAWRTRNVAFYGTNCVEGTGKGVVARTGDKTAIGSIAKATQMGTKPETQMKIEIDRFVNIIAVIAICIGVVFFIAAVFMGYTILDSVIFTIGIIVANVPEGLLCTVTIALTITAQNMANKNVLVKSTLIVETLGSVTAIASDKTGTLTQNRMTVRHAIYSDGSIHVAPHLRRDSTATIVDVMEDTKAFNVVPIEKEKSYDRSFMDKLVAAAGLCNHAKFEERENPILRRKTVGDASETALLKFCHSNTSVYDLRSENPEVACLSFNSRNKLMVTMHKTQDRKDKRKLIMKGAPERILDRCDRYVDHSGECRSLTEVDRAALMRSQETLAANGERILGFAEFIMTGASDSFIFDTDELATANYPTTGYTFVGMLSLEDPPREEVPDSIKACQEAGVKVVMVTGDHPLTARSIAYQIGILKPERDGTPTPLYDVSKEYATKNDESKDGVVVNGADIDLLNDEDWSYILSRDGVVFARTLPAQKQDIVSRLQSKGDCVAVTGDGVNDSPALKKADVGVAMGSGSDVAKEAGDLILLDDNFASIVVGVKEGRIIFSNLKKSIAYTLTSNIPEIFPFLAQIVLKIPLALTTILILCIDLGTDILPAISFAYEQAETDVMQRPPRDRKVDKLVTFQLIGWSYLQIGVIQALAAFIAFFTVFNRKGFSTERLLTSQSGFDWVDENYDGVIVNDDGNPVSYGERLKILQHAQTAYLAAIVISQIGCGLAAKTRLNSIVAQGVVNMVFNYGVLQEIVLIILLTYVPPINYAFKTLPIDGVDWAIAIPFSIFIVLYDEVRKVVIRAFGVESCFGKYFYW